MLFAKCQKPEPYPFPFLSALAISNDCEFQTEKAYRFFERQLTSSIGLRLPISHSIFFFALQATCHSSIGYFEGLTRSRSQHAAFLKELNQNGAIDTIHAFGDFDLGGFRREYAEWVSEEIEKENLSFAVYSNHGSSLNFQNMGHRDLADYQQGDKAGSPYYHADILDRSGIEFFWVDNGVDLEFTPRRQLLYQKVCRDEKVRTFFHRYRGMPGRPAPNAGSVSDQITEKLINDLVQTRSSIICYQHLGVLRKNPDGSFDSNDTAPCFSDEGWKTWALLADKFRSKEIWITTVSNLLRYERLRDSVSVASERTAEGLTWVIHSAAARRVSDFSLLWFQAVELPKHIYWFESKTETKHPLKFDVVKLAKGFGVLFAGNQK